MKRSAMVIRRVAALLNGLCVLVLLALLLPAVCLQAAGRLQDTDCPVLGGWTVCTVSDDAMQPLLNRGDLLFLQAGEPYAAGELVAYRDDGGVLLGRVMLAGGRSYTLGNAGATAVRAAGVTSGQLLGRVRLRVGCLGAVLAWARTPRGLAALLLAGVLLAELPSFLQPVKKPRRKQPGGYPAAGSADGASQ